MGIESNNKYWISKDVIYTHTSKGGFGIIRLESFVKAIKVSWIKRYSIDKIDDNWADMIDTFFHLTPDNRHTIHNFGPERFNKIIKAEIPIISSLFSAYKTFKYNFPTDPSTMDNSWLNQCAFYNQNITRKQPRRNYAEMTIRPYFKISVIKNKSHTPHSSYKSNEPAVRQRGGCLRSL